MTFDLSSAVKMKLYLSIPIGIMLLLAVAEPSQLDLWLTDQLYQPGVGFIGAKSFFLEDILHDRAKEAAIGVVLIAFCGWLSSYVFPSRIKIDRRRWLYVATSMLVAGCLITPLKRLTEVHCPWSLDRYGGVETYSSVMSKRPPPVEKAGQCWPAGHASSGFTLFALFFALRDKRPRAAKIALGTAIAIGLILGGGRMLQGAHFLSHNIWTALIDWLVCAIFYRIMLYKPALQEC